MSRKTALFYVVLVGLLLASVPALSDDGLPDPRTLPDCDMSQPPDCYEVGSTMCVIWQEPEDCEPDSDCSLTGIQKHEVTTYVCVIGVPGIPDFSYDKTIEIDEPCDVPSDKTDGHACDHECYTHVDQTNNDECTESAPQYRICKEGTCSNGECTNREVVSKTRIEDYQYGDTDGKTCREWCDGRLITSFCVDEECRCTPLP